MSGEECRFLAPVKVGRGKEPSGHVGIQGLLKVGQHLAPHRLTERAQYGDDPFAVRFAERRSDQRCG